MAVYRRKDTASKRYYFKFQIRGVTYKRNIPTARTLRQAEEAERKARDDVHNGIYGSHADMLFSDFVVKHYLPWAEQHHKNRVSDKTMTNLLCEHFKGFTLGRISRFAVDGFKLKLAKTETIYGGIYKPNSVNLALAYLSMILNLAVEYKKIRENPVRKVKRLPVEEKRPRHLSHEEEARLLIACDRKRWLRPLVQMAIWTGFRQSELLGLQSHHLDFSGNLIFVPYAKWSRDKRKTEGNPMSKSVRELTLGLSGAGYLFTDRGTKLSKTNLDSHFRKACAEAGIQGLTFHALRHTFGTRLGEQDVNLKKIARLMGHASTKHTEIYVHTTDEGLSRAMEIAASQSQKRTAVSEIRIAETG